MVRGIGVDIVEIDRIRESIERLGDAFLAKVFTPHEIAYCTSKPNQHQHFAARFAAKEAVSKALATGWSGEFAWKDVEITNDPLGKPLVTLHGRLGETLAGCTVFLSISHDDTRVVAMALIESPSA